MSLTSFTPDIVRVDSTQPVIACSKRKWSKKGYSASAKNRYTKRYMSRASLKSKDTRRKSADCKRALMSSSEILCFLSKRRTLRNCRPENRSRKSSGAFTFSVDRTNADIRSVSIGDNERVSKLLQSEKLSSGSSVSAWRSPVWLVIEGLMAC